MGTWAASSSKLDTLVEDVIRRQERMFKTGQKEKADSHSMQRLLAQQMKKNMLLYNIRKKCFKNYRD